MSATYRRTKIVFIIVTLMHGNIFYLDFFRNNGSIPVLLGNCLAFYKIFKNSLGIPAKLVFSIFCFRNTTSCFYQIFVPLNHLTKLCVIHLQL